MRLPEPKAPPYDLEEWKSAPWPQKTRLACQGWALHGYGAPLVLYALYMGKVGLYICGWIFFCSFTPGLVEGAFLDWVFQPAAFQKAILWSMAYEGLGLGCGSGPLTGRYHPPIGGALYFARPGTTKSALFPRLPVLGGFRRVFLDVCLYLALLLFLFHALTASEVQPSHVLPCVLLMPMVGLADKTAFLSFRPEHYLSTLVCFLFVDDWIAGAMAVQLAIWIWAAISKLNPHFSSVLCVMLSNSPLFRSETLRKRLYKKFPEDLRPSKAAERLARAGMLVELCFPLLLAFGGGSQAALAGLVVMALFHAFIAGNFPMAVPIEWNVMTVYGAVFLFGFQGDTAVWSITSPLLAVYLLAALVAVPLYGNLRPDRVSFLLAMRYYAGNWPYSIWLFRGESAQKLEKLVKPASGLVEQLSTFYGEHVIQSVRGKLMAFRAMHLQGRVLQRLLPLAMDDLEDCEYLDGELVGGLVLGWNFGDGFLHNESLMEAVQAQCGFTPGELRCVFVGAQPLGGEHIPWRIADASTGGIVEGRSLVEDLQERQPWLVEAAKTS
jgi:hypothetical protein